MMNMGAASDILNYQIKRNKILSFTEKDIIITTNYESEPFKNKNHAIECLIPYHIFQLIPDDIKFKGSDIDLDLNKEVEILINKTEKIAEEFNIHDPGFTPQLLLYYEQKYINSLATQSNKASNNKKRKSGPNRESKNIRIPKSKKLYVYGDCNRIHIILDKKEEE